LAFPEASSQEHDITLSISQPERRLRVAHGASYPAVGLYVHEETDDTQLHPLDLTPPATLREKTVRIRRRPNTSWVVEIALPDRSLPVPQDPPPPLVLRVFSPSVLGAAQLTPLPPCWRSRLQSLAASLTSATLLEHSRRIALTLCEAVPCADGRTCSRLCSCQGALRQPLWECTTCQSSGASPQMEQGDTVCAGCAMSCHRGHTLVAVKQGAFVDGNCDCNRPGCTSQDAEARAEFTSAVRTIVLPAIEHAWSVWWADGAVGCLALEIYRWCGARSGKEATVAALQEYATSPNSRPGAVLAALNDAATVGRRIAAGKPDHFCSPSCDKDVAASSVGCACSPRRDWLERATRCITPLCQLTPERQVGEEVTVTEGEEWKEVLGAVVREVLSTLKEAGRRLRCDQCDPEGTRAV